MAKAARTDDETGPGPDELRTPKPDYQKSSNQANVDDDDPAPDRLHELKNEQKDLGTQLAEARAKREAAAAEEAVLVAQAAVKNAEIMRLVGTPAMRPTDSVAYAKAAKAKGEKLVKMVVPKYFKMRLDDHTMLDVMPGVREFPEKLASHWWLAANGCTPAE